MRPDLSTTPGQKGDRWTRKLLSEQQICNNVHVWQQQGRVLGSHQQASHKHRRSCRSFLQVQCRSGYRLTASRVYGPMQQQTACKDRKGTHIN
jgi:hypothetical protein